MKKWLASIRDEAKSYGSLPFWSWNDRLQPDELRRQIGVMDSLGIHGFFMHARGGLETEYLSDEWFDCVNACVDEAKKRGMEAWAYDENGWPSGFAGGALLHDEDNLARYVEGRVEESFPQGDDVLGVYKIENGTCRAAAADDNPPFHVVYTHADPSYVDTLRGDVIAKFIQATHAEYQKRVGADFGGAMPGFFTDEPQYYRYNTPYSKILPETFANRYGYPVTDALPALFWDFAGDTAYRYDYYWLLHDLFIRNYVRTIYEWCEENGCQLTGHAIEENTLRGQMSGCAGIMEFYRYQHIPGVDYLGRWINGDMGFKQLGSVCAQTGRTKALSEMFAGCGWDVKPLELKRIADVQYANGVNLICQHLYPYSERGQRKRDYPAHYSEHNPWQPHMADMERHYSRLGRILADGEEYAPVLVVHPIRDIYRLYIRKNPDKSKPVEDKAQEMSHILGTRQVPYHYGDETMLSEMATVENGRLRLGQCTYDYVIVPDMTTLAGTTVALLREFAAQGGRICFYGAHPTECDGRPADLSDLHGNITFDEICDAVAVRTAKRGQPIPELRQRIRTTADGARVIFTANITENDVYGIRTVIRNCTGVVGVDLDTLETYPVEGELLPDGSLAVTYDLTAGASCVLVQQNDAQMLPVAASRGRKTPIAFPYKWYLCDAPKNALALDHIQISKDGGATYADVLPLERVRDELLRENYCGELRIRYPFTVQAVPKTATLIWETAHILSASVNGRTVESAGYVASDRGFAHADVADCLRVGENEVVLVCDYRQSQRVFDVIFGNLMESMRNSLNIDTEIENVYLLGDFRVDLDETKLTKDEHGVYLYSGALSIGAPRNTVNVCDLVRDGFPFFGGSMCVECDLPWEEGMPTVFRPVGRFAVVELEVNGKAQPTIFFRDEIDLAGVLVPGVNHLRARMTVGLRNLAGSLHFAESEPFFTHPTAFSFERGWYQGKCQAYKPYYAWVKTGI